MQLMNLVHRYINMQPRVRESLMKIMYGNRDRDVNIFQKPIRINSLLENGYYRASKKTLTNSLLRDELHVFNRISLFLRDNTTFVDIGANVGLFSSAFADINKLFPNFEVVAFEANPDTYKRLKINGDRYGFRAINSAIGATADEVDFVLGAVSGIAATAENRTIAHIPGRGFTISRRRLDSFDLKGDLVLKIDVEGQEMEVMQGASELLKAGRIAAAYIDGFGNTELPDFLMSFGLRLFDPATLDPWHSGHYAIMAVNPRKFID